MSRFRKTAFEDLIEAASVMLWWVNLILACITYLVFHEVASINFSNAVIVKTITGIIQYIAPLIFVLGACISAVKQWKRKTIFDKQKSIETICKLSWQSFEYLISEAYRRKGYTVEETTDGPDGGVDLIVKKENRIFLVQCKHWQAKKVGVKEVRELKGVVSGRDAYGGILVTSGQFTRDAIEEAKNLNIELVDGKALAKLIPHIDESQLQKESVPTCPKCGSDMIKRMAKQGQYAGKHFWGCATFPKCRMTINIQC